MNGLGSAESAKGLIPVGAVKLKLLADGAAKSCCCGTPLTPFVAEKALATAGDLIKDGPVGVGLTPGVRRRWLPLASRILTTRLVRCEMTRADARTKILTSSLPAGPGWPFEALGYSSCWRLLTRLLSWVDCESEIRLAVWTYHKCVDRSAGLEGQGK